MLHGRHQARTLGKEDEPNIRLTWELTRGGARLQYSWAPLQ